MSQEDDGLCANWPCPYERSDCLNHSDVNVQLEPDDLFACVVLILSSRQNEEVEKPNRKIV